VGGLKFLFRRAVHTALLLLAVSSLSLALLRSVPGDYFETMRLNPQISRQTLSAKRAEAGLDKPFPILYWRWLKSAAQGDWGFSFAYNRAAGAILWPRARNTLVLTVCAALLAWILALPVGIAAGARILPFADLLASAATALLLAIPELLIALGMLLLATRFHQLFPRTAASLLDLPIANSWTSLWHPAGRLFVPALCLCAAPLPLFISHIRASVAEALEAPFASAARTFGIPERRILFRYALPAALNPVISLFGLSIGLLMSSSLVIEGVFAWPGMGQLMLEAIADHDIFLIVDSAVLAAAFLVFGNLAADALLFISDPRFRAQ
jgi:peptide/nickel transport system permease protein